MNVLIVCRVVDHFGDAGVCLRLVKGLAARSHRVSLLIDRPDLALAMQPALRLGERVGGIRLMDWSDSAVSELCTDLTPKSLLIEIFHHEAPEPLRAHFEALPGAARVMLDYLATERWADSMQGMSAVDRSYRLPQRYWWAPSFSKGLPLGDPKQLKKMLDGKCSVERPASDVFWVLGFGYADAPWAAFENAVKTHGLPDGYRSMQIHFPSGIERSQDDFDALLCSTDLNFVRGEDSFVRAHWAAASNRRVPFVWQPYRQEGLGHADKLGGWMEQVLVDSSLEPWRRLHLAFNGLGAGAGNKGRAGDATASLGDGLAVSDAWRDCLAAWPEIRRALSERARGLAKRDFLDAIFEDLSL